MGIGLTRLAPSVLRRASTTREAAPVAGSAGAQSRHKTVLGLPLAHSGPFWPLVGLVVVVFVDAWGIVGVLRFGCLWRLWRLVVPLSGFRVLGYLVSRYDALMFVAELLSGQHSILPALALLLPLLLALLVFTLALSPAVGCRAFKARFGELVRLPACRRSAVLGAFLEELAGLLHGVFQLGLQAGVPPL